MLKCYGEFLQKGEKITYSLLVDTAREADKRFLALAKTNSWQYLGIEKIINTKTK